MLKLLINLLALMMKKVLCVLLTVLMLLSMAACSKEEPQDTANVPVTSEDTQPQKETTEATEETKKEEESLQEFMFPLMPVYCKVPEEFGYLSNGMVAVASGCDEYVLSIYNGFEGDYTGELEGLLAFVADIFVADLNKYLSQEKKEYVVSRQICKSGTSIGANIAEAQRAQSTADFVAKMRIALKEANETQYWLQLLHETKYITDKEFSSCRHRERKCT